MVNVYNPEITTNLAILHESGEPIVVVMGDACGNLSIFDLRSGRREGVDNIREKIRRRVEQQNYGEIVQILSYKQFLFCLVNRHYQPDGTWRLLKTLLRRGVSTRTL
jgi:hypothetical protein